MKELRKLIKGDRVAILSPSSGVAGIFPWVLDHGLNRLVTHFGLVPVEYPTTRKYNSSIIERAKDINAAFLNPDIKAIITSIGGNDQIKILKYLNVECIRDNPKPFFGFSDNTNIIQFLWSLGIPSYYGGSIMTQYAMQKEMHQITIDSLNKALFTNEEYRLPVSKEFTDIDLEWGDKSNLNKNRQMEKNDGWYWDGDNSGEGLLWGGCVETMLLQLSTNLFLPTQPSLDKIVLFLETAEDIPEHWIIEYLLVALGERGILQRSSAILIGRPKAWESTKRLTAEQKKVYKQQQREIVVKTIREYNKKVTIIQNIDFGHTDPQIILPVGNIAKVNTDKRLIYFQY